jgi:hypothetical protein
MYTLRSRSDGDLRRTTLDGNADDRSDQNARQQEGRIGPEDQPQGLEPRKAKRAIQIGKSHACPPRPKRIQPTSKHRKGVIQRKARVHGERVTCWRCGLLVDPESAGYGVGHIYPRAAKASRTRHPRTGAELPDALATEHKAA